MAGRRGFEPRFTESESAEIIKELTNKVKHCKRTAKKMEMFRHGYFVPCFTVLRGVLGWYSHKVVTRFLTEDRDGLGSCVISKIDIR